MRGRSLSGSERANAISNTAASAPQVTNATRTPATCVSKPMSSGPAMSPNSLNDWAAPSKENALTFDQCAITQRTTTVLAPGCSSGRASWKAHGR